MKLLCIKDVICRNDKTGEEEKSFTKDKIYNSRFFRSGTLLYSVDDFQNMHIVAECTDEIINDSWFYEHFNIIDKDNRDW